MRRTSQGSPQAAQVSQRDRWRILLGVLAVPIAAVVATLATVVLLQRADARPGVLAVVGPAVFLGVLIVGFWLLRRFGRRSGDRDEEHHHQQAAAWASANRWRVLGGAQAGLEPFPTSLRAPALEPVRCHQVIDGHLDHRSLRIECWDVAHRPVGAPWTLAARRQIVTVGATEKLPLLALADFQRIRYVIFNVPASIADRAMTREAGMFYASNTDATEPVLGALRPFFDQVKDSEAWVILAPRQVTLNFQHNAGVEVLRTRVRLAEAIARSLDRARGPAT